MLIRYTKNEKGKLVKQAEIYTKEEHNIPLEKVDADAIRALERLRREGYQAYIVGGAVRDLLLGKEPKDFDLVTDAEPSRVRKIFRKSRIIGKRFKLVHLYYSDKKILELATFRSVEASDRKNLYGTIEEDVLRRDFSFNALFYSPQEEQVLDYVSGVKDLRKEKIVSIISLKHTFVDDPVRMVRALKYSVTTGSKIPFKLRRAIKRSAPLLMSCSVSRLSEEIFKILQSGHSWNIFQKAVELDLFHYLLPEIEDQFHGRGGKVFYKNFFKSLRRLDENVKRKGERRRSRMIRRLVQPSLDKSGILYKPDLEYGDVLKEAKQAILPMIAPNRDIEDAVRLIFKVRNIKVPKRSTVQHPDRRKAKRSRNRSRQHSLSKQ
ncbi:MAG: polynucleotide adenylyltransferase PcnB [Spirochaetaceae bacterium]|nr:polynucleotide adenylyltransferase PcnB [Spirochaetaceae bacterium]